MAPIAVEVKRPELVFDSGQYKELSGGPKTYKKKFEGEGSQDQPKAAYPHYLPTWNPEQKYPPLKPFNHVEHGLDADEAFAELLGAAGHKEDLTPTIGSIIRGVQLSGLSSADFADLPIRKALDFGVYFGRLHVHPTSGSPEGYPEGHVVHRGAGDKNAQQLLEERTSSVAWHSDVTYEEQPPGTTFLYIFDKPSAGGDTIFVDQAEAYRRLSPGFKERLHGLIAVHSGIEQADSSRARGGIVRREPVTNVHPIVRTHPATGEKALFVNPQCKMLFISLDCGKLHRLTQATVTQYIVGYKKEGSQALLKFLYDHIGFGADFQARVKWQAKTVVAWDASLERWRDSTREIADA